MLEQEFELTRKERKLPTLLLNQVVKLNESFQNKILLFLRALNFSRKFSFLFSLGVKVSTEKISSSLQT